MWQAIIWTNTDPIHRRIYAALGGDKLRKFFGCYLAAPLISCYVRVLVSIDISFRSLWKQIIIWYVKKVNYSFWSATMSF